MTSSPGRPNASRPMAGASPAARSLAAQRPRKARAARPPKARWVDRVLFSLAGLLALGVVAGVWAQQLQMQQLRTELSELRRAHAAGQGPMTPGPSPARAAAAAAAPPAHPAEASPAHPPSKIAIGAVAAAGPGLGPLAPPVGADTPVAPLPPEFPIAGLPEALAQVAHCDPDGRAGTAYRQRFVAPIRAWAREHLDGLRVQRLVYPFSGPDAATAAALFAQAPHLVLVADQWVEPLHALASAPAAVRQSECRVLDFHARSGYFRTNDLEGRNGPRPRFLSLLIHNLHLAELRIEHAEYLGLDETGHARPVLLAGARPAGIRFHARRPDGTPARVDYLRIDLSDGALQRQAAERAFLQAALSDGVLLKSASHLLQEPSFAITAGLVRAQARALVQDESGMAIDALTGAFELRLHGDFRDAHRLWAGKASARRLREFHARVGPVEPLGFQFGYEKPAGSLIIVGRRADPSATPVVVGSNP